MTTLSDISSLTVEDIHDQVHILENILGLTKDVLSASKIDQVHEIIISWMVHVFLCNGVHVYIVDNRQKHALMCTGLGGGANVLIEHGYKVRIDASTILGQCILCKKVVIVGSEPTPIFPVPHIVMILPLIDRKGRVIECIEIFTTNNNFSKNYLPHFEMMANFIGVVIDKLSA